MRKRSALPFAFLLVLASSFSMAADETAQARIPTVTRWVKVFTERELALQSSARAGDEAALQTMLADDFEMRTGVMPANPTPKAEWIRQSLQQRDASFAIEQMAVHDLGDQAVVSFREASSTGAKRTPARDIFVVDVWTRAGDEWRLAIRYASPAGSSDFVIPGATPESRIIQKKY